MLELPATAWAVVDPELSSKANLFAQSTES